MLWRTPCSQMEAFEKNRKRCNNQRDKGLYWGGRNRLKGKDSRETMKGQPLKLGIIVGVKRQLLSGSDTPCPPRGYLAKSGDK